MDIIVLPDPPQEQKVTASMIIARQSANARIDVFFMVLPCLSSSVLRTTRIVPYLRAFVYPFFVTVS